MLYVQATKKAREVLGVGREPLDPPGRTESALGNWMLNVVPIGKREALLFMSTRSLLSFPILIGQQQPGPENLPTFMSHGLAQLMHAMGIPSSQSSRLLRDLDELALCRAEDKSLLGMFSAVAGDYFRGVNRKGGLPKANLGAVIAEVNSLPRAPLGWRTSLEVSSELLQNSEA